MSHLKQTFFHPTPPSTLCLTSQTPINSCRRVASLLLASHLSTSTRMSAGHHGVNVLKQPCMHVPVPHGLPTDSPWLRQWHPTGGAPITKLEAVLL